jgi:toxin ParE1/3/4
MPTYSFAPSVRQQIREIVTRIKSDDMLAARKWFEQLNEKCRTLAETPRAGRIREDLLPNLYMFPYGNYLIFYDIIPSGIQIVHVVHAARDIRNTFG